MPALHQPTQHRLVGDDGGIETGVGRRRHGGDQGVQIRGAADAAQQPAAIELGGHGDGIRGLTAPVQVEDRVIDVLVGRTIEVAGTQPLQYVSDRVLAQQHAAEDSLLGRHVLRRLPAEVLPRRRAIHIRIRMPQVVHHRHGLPTPFRNPLARARTSIRIGTATVEQGSDKAS